VTRHGQLVAANTIRSIADDPSLEGLSPAVIVAIAVQRAIDNYEATLTIDASGSLMTSPSRVIPTMTYLGPVGIRTTS
jgi:hypothetical protein